ncbi:MAG: FimB/Mfa2 family fimbrial subunit [Bacteroidales bacterium]|nr:FimB/Mfa2 family fimbrial subunit [Bacteroidales bacterium]
MKRPILILLVAVLSLPILSCRKGDATLSTLNVIVSPFVLTDETMPETKSLTAMERIDAVLYNSNSQPIARIHQARSTEGNSFGMLSFPNLTAGQYTLVILGHNSTDTMTIISPTRALFANNTIKDCFLRTQTITVGGQSTQNLTLALNRVVTRFVVVATDAVPTGVSKLRVIFSEGGTELNPTTTFAANSGGRSVTYNIASRVGQSNLTVGTNLFPTSASMTASIDIQALDDSETVLFSHNLPSVALQPNHCVTARGDLFGTNASLTITLDTAWVYDTIAW